MRIPIAIADDHADLIAGLVQNLELFAEIEVVITAQNGQQFCEKLVSSPVKPQVVLMDIDMPVMNGIEATGLIHDMYPEIKVVMLTVFDDDNKIFDAIQAGANGYLLKDAKPAKIMQAIEDALDGGVPMSPAIATRTLELLLDYAPAKSAVKSTAEYHLSSRETEVLKLLATGKNYQQIAEVLFLSPKTIRGHIERIYNKLHVHNKIDAVNLARKNRWL
ncbi:MAG: response regulator transcription factor [Chitinophagaceae bacterium]|jgi:DNA-binding NarL/FixJ family response regulator|nr:response regulator transcription factor [Chitinophagaceae bacterium]